MQAATRPIPERKRNPFMRFAGGGRLLSATMLPFFTVIPPSGFGVLTTTGRRSGKSRRRCIHAIQEDGKVYVVMIRPPTANLSATWVSAWVWNIRSEPKVNLRIRRRSFAGRMRELTDQRELAIARETYCETVNTFDYVEHTFHRKGLPTRAKIREMHRSWFDTGIPLVIDLARDRD